jgi:ribulose-phosphate 3-epimerase
MTIRIAPSLASVPLERLQEAVAALESAGADMLHFDLEDGVFVPVMTLGTKIIADTRPLTDLPFDVHLMMVNPEWIIPHLVEIGVQRITVHYEACPYPRRVLGLIIDHGARAGLAFNPATPLPDLTDLQPYLQMIDILTTEPETQGAPFLPPLLDKVREGQERYPDVEWIVDGGITADNARSVAEAGADTLVVGRFIFQQDDITGNLRGLRTVLNGN